MRDDGGGAAQAGAQSGSSDDPRANPAEGGMFRAVVPEQTKARRLTNLDLLANLSSLAASSFREIANQHRRSKAGTSKLF